MAEIFREGEKVRWKNAHFMDTRNHMTIKKIGKMGGIEKALCEYVRNSDPSQTRFSVTLSEFVRDWFPFSELEHL